MNTSTPSHTDKNNFFARADFVHDDFNRDNLLRNIVLQKAVLLLIAAALNAIELAVPRVPFLPWLKPGFANIITVIWVVKYGFKDAMLFTALRVWISGFYFGFSLFTFSLAMTGGLLSTMMMSALWMFFGRRKFVNVGTVGLAVVGALFHNVGQLSLVYLMMDGNIGILTQIPFMLCASVVFGAVVGLLVPVTARIVCDDVCVDSDICADDNNVRDDVNTNNSRETSSLSTPSSTPSSSTITDKLIVTATFATSISLMFVGDIYVLIVAAIIFSTAAVMLTKKIGAIIYPLKFYLLFVFIAATQIFLSGGNAGNVWQNIYDHENTFLAVKQILRLWCWLQTIHVFKKFNFDVIFMSILRKFFPRNPDTLAAGMIALKHFPQIVRRTKLSRKISVIQLLTKPKTVMIDYVAEMKNRIARAVGAE